MNESKLNKPSSPDEWEQEEDVRRLLARVRHSLDETDGRLIPSPVEAVWAKCDEGRKPMWRISPWWLVAASVVGFVLGWVCRLEGPGSSDALLVCADTVQVDSSLAGPPGTEAMKPQAPLPERSVVTAEAVPVQAPHPAPSYRVPAPQREATTAEVVTGRMAVRHTAESMDWNLLISYR